jgi:polyisoprenoid-binding protein YceI
MTETQKVQDRSQTSWVIEPKYTSFEFSVKSLFFFTVKGKFTDFIGNVVIDDGDIQRSSVEVTIKAPSISTGVKRRDDHLRSAAFLDVAKHPIISFQSTGVEKGRDRDTLRVTGNLWVKGRTKELVLDVEETDHSRSPQGDEVAYFIAQTKIDRFDFGVRYGRWLIGRTLRVTIQAQATKKSEQ